MNIFELGFAALTVGGAVQGARWGFEIHGVFGAAIGAFVGAICGMAIAYAATFAIAVVASIFTGGPLFPPKLKPSSQDGAKHDE
jgi:ABC-type lipoprotein release transport system permease subunit